MMQRKYGNWSMTSFLPRYNYGLTYLARVLAIPSLHIAQASIISSWKREVDRSWPITSCTSSQCKSWRSHASILWITFQKCSLCQETRPLPHSCSLSKSSMGTSIFSSTISNWTPSPERTGIYFRWLTTLWPGSAGLKSTQNLIYSRRSTGFE